MGVDCSGVVVPTDGFSRLVTALSDGSLGVVVALRNLSSLGAIVAAGRAVNPLKNIGLWWFLNFVSLCHRNCLPFGY